MENELEDFVVVMCDSVKRYGLARPPSSRHGSQSAMFFGYRNIITEGEDTLKPGSKILARRAQDTKHSDRQMLVDIEIYIAEESAA